MACERWVCGPYAEQHVAAVQEFVDAGFDEVQVLQMGSCQREMIDFYAREVLPHFSDG